VRLKPVPPVPEGLDAVFDVQAALPLTPGTESDCCARVVARTFVDQRGDAEDWLSFLRALGLARETGGKYVRERVEPTGTELAGQFCERVYGAREVVAALGDTPKTGDDVFESVDIVPRWERERNPEWEAAWRERVARLLDWAVLFGLAGRRNGGYVADG